MNFIKIYVLINLQTVRMKIWCHGNNGKNELSSGLLLSPLVEIVIPNFGSCLFASFSHAILRFYWENVTVINLTRSHFFEKNGSIISIFSQKLPKYVTGRISYWGNISKKHCCCCCWGGRSQIGIAVPY